MRVKCDFSSYGTVAPSPPPHPKLQLSSRLRDDSWRVFLLLSCYTCQKFLVCVLAVLCFGVETYTQLIYLCRQVSFKALSRGARRDSGMWYSLMFLTRDVHLKPLVELQKFSTSTPSYSGLEWSPDIMIGAASQFENHFKLVCLCTESLKVKVINLSLSSCCSPVFCLCNRERDFFFFFLR